MVSWLFFPHPVTLVIQNRDLFLIHGKHTSHSPEHDILVIAPPSLGTSRQRSGGESSACLLSDFDLFAWFTVMIDLGDKLCICWR